MQAKENIQSAGFMVSCYGFSYMLTVSNVYQGMVLPTHPDLVWVRVRHCLDKFVLYTMSVQVGWHSQGEWTTIVKRNAGTYSPVIPTLQAINSFAMWVWYASPHFPSPMKTVAAVCSKYDTETWGRYSTERLLSWSSPTPTYCEFSWMMCEEKGAKKRGYIKL